MDMTKEQLEEFHTEVQVHLEHFINRTPDQLKMSALLLILEKLYREYQEADPEVAALIRVLDGLATSGG